MPVFEAVRYIIVALLTLSCLPLSTIFVFFNYVYISLFPLIPIHKRLKKIPGFISRTILITGVNTPHGLRLARAFYETGHRVVGADYEPSRLPIHVRFSKALDRFYRFPSNAGKHREVAYIASLVQVIEREHAEMWINCTSSADVSTQAEARRVIEQNTSCQCFALRPNDVPNFASPEAFLKCLAASGLRVPETYQVTSRSEIHNVLNKARGTKRYLLQSLDENGVHANSARTMLPSRTVSQTYNTVSRIPITTTMPWKLQEDINGLEKYSTFAVVVGGSVKAFIASRSKRAGCYQAIEPSSALSRSMLQFVHTFARKQGSDFTTHLGIDFCIEEQATESGVIQAILPVQVSVHAQAAIQLFHGLDGSIALTRAYLACLAAGQSNAGTQMTRPGPAIIQQQTVPEDVAMPDPTIPGTYCFGQDLLHMFLEPLYGLLTFRSKSSLNDSLRLTLEFLNHLAFWEDDTYNFQGQFSRYPYGLHRFDHTHASGLRQLFLPSVVLKHRVSRDRF